MKDMKNMARSQWAEKKISILGAGMSGIAAAKLGRYLGAYIFISDKSNAYETIEKMKEFEHEAGKHSARILDADLLILSPGVSGDLPIIAECRQNNIPIVSEIEFASWFTSSPILALTGSNGKTTTINLLHEMCVSAGKNSLLGGNIGIPFSENVLWELKSKMARAVHVLELSSFQLEHIQFFNPLIAGLLNISEDHMNRYTDIHNYAQQKYKITKNIMGPNWIIYNADDPLLLSSFKNKERTMIFSLHSNENSHFKLNASKIYSGPADSPDILFHLEETKLRGGHNLQNILAAATMAHAFGLKPEAIRDAIINFTPISHRLEWVGNINGVNYFNDSKATNIAATRAAIISFDNPLILILGGVDKGKSDFTQLNRSLKKRVKHIITYGEAGASIKNQLKSEFTLSYIQQFDEAVLYASEISDSGDIVLLSPACTSFDQFKNYEERGDEFKNIFYKIELKI